MCLKRKTVGGGHGFKNKIHRRKVVAKYFAGKKPKVK